MRHGRFAFSLLIAALLLLAGPVIAQTREQTNTTELPPPVSSAPPGAATDLRDPLSTSVTAANSTLGPGDLLEISVFDTPELSQRVRIASNGTIRLALIGEIQAGGMTLADLRQLIAKLLVDGRYVKDPQVSLFVVEYSGQLVYVLGEVNRPGAYPLLRSHRLQDLISVAGGLNPRAGNTVTIARSGKPALVIQLNSSSKDENNPEIQPGDRISVEQAGIVYVLGEVGRPGGFLIDRHNHVTVMQALALAEGIQSGASIKKAAILRGTADSPQLIPVNIAKILKLESPDIPVQGGDVLYIYGSLTRGLGRSVIQTVLATASAAAIYVEVGR
jgi:polysaccharide export outer membrane protein